MARTQPTQPVTELERTTMRRVAWRLLPFLILCYLIAIIDRGNIGMASLQMNHDLGLSPAIFGFASSLFFVSYFLVEVPSNLALQKFGARIWIARIMITWGLISAGTAFVQGANSLYVMRFLLGAAEAGFFPGVLLYMTYWLPSAYRARMVAIFMVAIPGANFLGSPLSGYLLTLDGWMGMRGWHWLFILEGIPAVLLGIACLFILTDRPAQARWLDDEQRTWLVNKLDEERKLKTNIGHISLWKLLKHKDIWVMALIYSGASAAGSTMSVWAPQLLKSFGLSNLEIGFVNAIPYGIASVAMIIWGRSSDRSNERRWHTSATLFLITAGLLLALVTSSLPATVVMLTMVLIGAYSMKGPFWALVSNWLSSSTAAAGLAAIGALANLIGGGIMVNAYGAIHQATGSYAIALLPLAALCTAGAIAVVVMGRSRKREAHEDAKSVEVN
ncbi:MULTISPECIES: MFS transporter [Pseudomonas syringae group]|jgi:ACS family tartrate transporter-like MFS transporter|uniref:Transporter-like membrane protein n=1 Tax=Pseudomonas syringae pv. lapsa TaxID=199201 RepID=A0AB74A0A6_PSESX|nr:MULTISPECIES: MFS transporter [Pseudomonas syringae group]ALU60712.1 MFS transporter permease [Pseudomonas syringae pv. lapsa]KPX65042.1 putative transporter-like membrane protein [Pseudomonas syringae pv. lapsa]KTC01411.1 MFS transporter permease [Pseudomonas syringae ICMP 11168]MBI6717564.1 MFS transporter [Pseudomonas syringae]MBI6755072.1 MFS transporter [Pseudomonas syringae]